MDDKCVIALGSASSSDDEDVTNKKKRKEPVVVEETAALTEEEHRISGGLNGVSSVTAVEGDSRVIIEETDSQSITSNKRINKRPKMNNQIDNDDMKKEDAADLGTTEVELVLVSDGEKLEDYIVRQRSNKIEDVETSKAIHVGGNVESMVMIGISSNFVEEEETDHLSSSNVDEVMLLTRPVVDVLVEGEHPDTVQASGTDGKQVDGEKSMEMLVMSGTELVLENSNSVMRKLLRGPRYFNRIDGEWEMCRNCGEEGHKSVMCTSKQRPKPCFVCGGLGHNGRKCIKGLLCLHCEGVGHASKKCPNRNEEHFPISCLRCGDSGHDMWKCNDFLQDDLKKIQCYICKNFGHHCCVGFPDLGTRQVSCCNCGCTGHVGSECTNKKPSTAKYLPCRKCGSQDHGGRRCKKRPKGAAEKAAIAESAAVAQRAAKAERAAIAESAAVAQRAAKAAKAAKVEKAAKAEMAAKAAKAAKVEKAAKAEMAAKAAKAHRKEFKKILGSKSAPHDLYRPQREIKISYEVRPGAGALLPRSRNEESNIRSNFRHIAPRSNVWRAPEPISQPNADQTPAYFSPDFLNPQNPFQTLSHPLFSSNSHESYSSSSSVPNTSPRNITQMLNHFASPVAHPYQTATNYQRIATPYPPTLVFNSPLVPPSQVYFPVGNIQAAASLYAPRNYPTPCNPVQRFSHPTPPCQLSFQPPWPGHY